MTPKRLLRIVAVPALAALVLIGCGETTETLFVDTTAPNAPTNLAVVSDGTSLAVAWAENAEADLAGYVLERTVDRGQTWETVSGVLTEASYVDSMHLSAAYRVAAVDLSSNQSGYSETAHYIRAPSGDGKNPSNPT